ncbi:MAG: OprO/OprP family phosphate-selective porin [Planctomycetota bacterium]
MKTKCTFNRPSRSARISLMLLFLFIGAHAGAAEPTPTDKALLERIEALEKRIEQLEGPGKKDANEPPETPGPPVEDKQVAEVPAEDLTLEKRVEKLEDAAAEAPEKSPYDLRAFWDKGLRLESADKQFKLKLGGRTAVDSAWFSQDSELERALGNEQDGIQFRRAYLYMAGLINGWIEYKSEYEFSGDEVGFEDVYIGFTNIPYLGKIRFGHIDEPFGLELRTSNRHTTFMERALTHAIIPGTETGVLAKNLIMDDRVFFNFGIFRDTDHGVHSGDGAYNVTGRIVGLPINEDDGTKLLHFGLSGSHRNPDGPVRFSSRPEANLSNFRYVDTGNILVDDEDLIGLEFAWVNGPLSLQSEYVLDSVDTELGGDANISAWYAFISYFLTGESRFYELGSATFDRPRVKKNFREGGPGAWEVAARFSSIDLEDGLAHGGKQDDVTLGLNWYFNPNTKLMFNYVHALVDHDLYDGNVDVLQMRAQVDF